MEEKKVTKIRLSTAILVFIIIVLIAALVITYYFGFVKEDENTETKQENLPIKIKKRTFFLLSLLIFYGTFY